MEYLEAKERMYSFVKNAKSFKDYQTKEWQIILNDYRIAQLKREIRQDKISAGTCVLILIAIIFLTIKFL